jgi:6-phosphogluconolactonase
MANNHFILNEFASKEELVDILAEKILHELDLAIQEKGHASLALSGGSTPKKLFVALSNSDFAWERVTVTLVDERWVDPLSEQSNEKLLKEYLLQNYAAKAKFIPLKSHLARAKEALAALEIILGEFIKHLDVVVLGMGEDAHTASFFPNAEELDFALNTKDLCCATTASHEPKERITLSRLFLLGANSLLLHIEGQKKKEIFLNAAKSDDTKMMPIIAMMQQTNPNLEVYYAD